MGQEKIQIFTLKVDVDGAIKSASDFKKQADGMKLSLDELKRIGDTSSETYVKLKGSYDAVNAEYRTSQREISKLTSLQDAEIKTIDQARNALSVVSSQWAKQASLYGENSKEVEELGKKKLELTNYLKQEEAATGDTSRNVGNYTNSVKSALQETGLFGSELSTVSEYTSKFGVVTGLASSALGGYWSQIKNAAVGTEGLTIAQKASAIASNIMSGALGILRVALISTGVGAIVIVLGSLIAYLTTTQAGIDKVTSVTKPLQAIFQSLIGVVQNLGEKLFNMASEPKKAFQSLVDFIVGNVVNRFKALGVIIEAIQNKDFKGLKDGLAQAVTGIEGLSDKISNAGSKTSKFFSDAAQKGKDIDRLNKEIANDQLKYNRSLEVTNDLIDAQKLKSKDTSLNVKEREKAANEIIRLTKELGAQEESIIQKKIKQLGLQQSLNDTSREGQQEMIDLESKLNSAQDRGLDAEIEQLKVTAAARKEANARAVALNKERLDKMASDKKAALDDSIAKLVQETELYKVQQLTKTQSDAQRLADLAITSAKEKTLLDLKRKEKLITELEYETGLQTIKNNATILNADIAKKDLEALKVFNDAKKEISDDIFIKGLKTQEEREVYALESQNAKDILALEKMELDAIQKEELTLLYEERLQGRLIEVRKTGAKTRLDNEAKTDKEALDLKRGIAQAELDIAVGLGNLLTGVLGDSVEAQGAALLVEKGIAAATIIIRTQVANATALAASPLTFGMPWVGYNNVMMGIGLASIATQVVTGLSNLKKPSSGGGAKLEKGGLMKIGGNYHSNGGTRFTGEDGTTFEAEKDELIGVMNRNAAAAFMGFNDAYPSKAGARKGSYATGGFVDRMNSGINTTIRSGDGMDYERLSESIANANRSLPSPTIAITEINNAQSKYIRLTDGATI